MKSISICTYCFITILLTTQLSFGNNIKGIVKDSNDKPLEFFTAAILTLSDSSIITGGAFLDGYFEFSNIKPDKYLLQISSVGYQTVSTPIDFLKNPTIDMGTIQMKTLELDEVTVHAKRPSFKQVEGRLIIDVKGTALSEAGDLFDALKRSPGLIVDNENNITVFGKGTPIIFINNREIHNNTEIESLQSDDILSIEIDRNPSAEYSASGNSVVRIKTRKITKDQVNLQLYNYSYFGRKFSNTSGIKINNRIRKTTFLINYSYSDYSNKNYEDSYEINQQENNIIDNRNYAVKNANTLKNNLFASINQEINDKHNIGCQYSYISTNWDQKSDADQIITQTTKDIINRKILKDRSDKDNLQTFNLNYDFIPDGLHSLTVVGDYTKVDDKSAEDINEQNNTSNSNLQTLIDNKNEYDIYSGKIDYQTPLFKSVKLQLGVKLSKVENFGNVISVDPDSNTENYKTEDKIDDRITAAYFTLKPKLKKFNLKAGLRYEYNNTNITSQGETVSDSTYGNWFPSALINKNFSEQFNATLSYSKKINRPSFNELSTDITYFDSLSYSVGNPEIKPTISHNFDLSFGLFNKLTVNFAYKNEKNARILSAVNDEVNADIVKYTPVNINKAEYLNLNIDYNYSGKSLNSTFSFGGEKPFIKIPYMGEYLKIRKFSWYIQTNNDFSVTQKTNLFANFIYQSSSKDLMTHFYSIYKLSVGMNTSFFDKKLKVALMVNDILNSSDNRWEDKYGNIIAGLDPDRDNTWVRLVIKYNFSDFKGGARKKSASESELNRL